MELNLPEAPMTKTPPRSFLQATSIAPGITVDDLAKSIAFYEGLGFAVGERWEDGGTLMGVMLHAGHSMYGLSQDDFAKGKDRVKGVGMRTWISTEQDIDELAARAKAAGVTLDSDPEDYPWGGRGFAVTDPDGFKLTISRERE